VNLRINFFSRCAADGSIVKYNKILSTMALNQITEIIDEFPDELRKVSRELVYSSTHVIGIGIRGELPSRIGNKCWLYHPEVSVGVSLVAERSNRSDGGSLARRTFLPVDCLLELLAEQHPSGGCQAPYYSGRRPFSVFQGGHPDGATWPVYVGPFDRRVCLSVADERCPVDWSLMLEVSQSKLKPVDEDKVIADSIAGLISQSMLLPEDEIVSVYHRK
jgi:hypothetical protein